jgi:ribosomal protein L28
MTCFHSVYTVDEKTVFRIVATATVLRLLRTKTKFNAVIAKILAAHK